jgi:hypothetical protein
VIIALEQNDNEESNKRKSKPNYATLSSDELYKSHPLFVVLIFLRQPSQGTFRLSSYFKEPLKKERELNQ